MNRAIATIAVTIAAYTLAACGGAASGAAAELPTVAPATAMATPTDTPAVTNFVDAPTMATNITANYPVQGVKVLSANGFPDATITDVSTTCLTESAGSAAAAAHFSCQVTFTLNAPDEGTVNQHWQTAATASSDSTGAWQWQATQGTQAIIP